ncbi:MAG TPA: hypothetical protein VGB24_15300 [Longimicrobium sp.]|jgi:hypothetical protein|uniref:hypothetical protein n=1 Tax=Longimicrobium sp. TaxID=2029185 RepID=UPI002EDBAE38
MRLSIALVVPVVLLSACVPPAVHQSAAAPENALACARESLERLGYAAEPAPGSSAFWARRTVDSVWVHRVEHLVNVTLDKNVSPALHVRGERLYTKSGREVSVPGVTLREPASYQRRLESDEVLATEVSQVIGECGASPGGQPRSGVQHAARVAAGRS